MLRILAIGIVLCLHGPASVSAQTVGEVLPAWSPGTLDIHEISTGRGGATFFLLPDGTTMLFDAGELAETGPAWRLPRYVAPVPDDTRKSGEWITRYVERLLDQTPADGIDFAIPSHFHGDHMGQVTDEAPQSSKGPFQRTGITTVGDELPIGTILDRAWPSYDYPETMDSPTMQNYRAFLNWKAENEGTKVARFEPGRNDQIRLQHDAAGYPIFEVRNLAANGVVWTGVEDVTRAQFPPLDDLDSSEYPSENLCSIAMRVSYGPFDYFTGGDILGIPLSGSPSWQDVETPVARAVGPVEVATLNHHGYIDSQNAFFVETVRPRVWLLSVWDSAHPTAMVYERIRSKQLYPGPRDIFATSMHQSNREVVVGLDELSSDQGHIVVRVAPGGDSYKVIVLDDSNEDGRIKGVWGPYEAR